MTDERDEFLRRANIATLATIGPGGWPHAVPIWYLLQEGNFLMISPEGAQKVKNLRRNGSATLVIDRREIPYFSVTVRGRVEVGGAPSAELYLRWAAHYLGDELARKYVAARPPEEEVCLLLRRERVTEFRSGLDRL